MAETTSPNAGDDGDVEADMTVTTILTSYSNPYNNIITIEIFYYYQTKI